MSSKLSGAQDQLLAFVSHLSLIDQEEICERLRQSGYTGARMLAGELKAYWQAVEEDFNDK